MLQLNTIKAYRAYQRQDFERFVGNVLLSGETQIGVFLHVDGKDPFRSTFKGASVYSGKLGEGVYIPFRPFEVATNFNFDRYVRGFRDLFEGRTVIFNDASVDLPFFLLKGIVPSQVRCIRTLGLLNMAENLDLDSLAKGYRVIPYGELPTYRNCVAKAWGVSERFFERTTQVEQDKFFELHSFEELHPAECKGLILYYVRMAAFLYHLYKPMTEHLEELVGSPEGAKLLEDVNTDTLQLLSQSTVKGYAFDTVKCFELVDTLKAKISIQERTLETEVLKLMGWPGKFYRPYPKFEKANHLASLQDGRFFVEPHSGKKKFKRSWSLESRHLMLHVIYNVLGQWTDVDRYDTSKMSSLKEEDLSRLAHPFCKGLAEYKRRKRMLTRLEKMEQYVRLGTEFEKGHVTHTPKRAVLQFDVLKPGSEQIYTRAKCSMPLSLDEEQKQLFTCPPLDRSIGMINRANRPFLPKVGTISDSVWLSFSWEHAELRLLSVLAKEDALKQDIMEHGGLWVALMASLVYGKPQEELEKAERQLVGSVIQEMVYRQFDPGFAKGVIERQGLEEEPVYRTVELFNARYPGIRQYLDDTLLRWCDNEMVTCAFGGLKDCPTKPGYLRSPLALGSTHEGRAAINSKISNSLAVLQKKVFSDIWQSKIKGFIWEVLPWYSTAFFFKCHTGDLYKVIPEVHRAASIRLRNNEFSGMTLKGTWKMSFSSLRVMEPLPMGWAEKIELGEELDILQGSSELEFQPPETIQIVKMDVPEPKSNMTLAEIKEEIK